MFPYIAKYYWKMRTVPVYCVLLWFHKGLFNSLAPERLQRNIRKVIFQLILVIRGWSISCKIVLKWMPMDLNDGKSTLVQVMAWCRQATSHYPSKCWPRSLSPYGVSRPQGVNSLPGAFFSRNINKYQQFLSFLHIDMTQLVEILLHVRQRPTSFT